MTASMEGAVGEWESVAILEPVAARSKNFREFRDQVALYVISDLARRVTGR